MKSVEKAIAAALKNCGVVPDAVAGNIAPGVYGKFEVRESRYGGMIIIPLNGEAYREMEQCIYDYCTREYGLPMYITAKIAKSCTSEKYFIAKGIARAISQGFQVKLMSLYNAAYVESEVAAVRWEVQFGVRASGWFKQLCVYEKKIVSEIMVEVAKKQGI